MVTTKQPKADYPATFDSSTKWERSAKIGLRPEPFGALAYHFDTRRLVFLKSPMLVDLVDGLSEHESADAAIEAIVEPVDDRSRHGSVIEDASPRNIWHFYADVDVNDFSLSGFQKFCK